MWCGIGAVLVRYWCGIGAVLVRYWCGIGAVLVRYWRASPKSSKNPIPEHLPESLSRMATGGHFAHFFLPMYGGSAAAAMGGEQRQWHAVTMGACAVGLDASGRSWAGVGGGSDGR